jgi:anaerobic dimethyl sulfoxide reductase subunit C (anchor subunit)
VLLRDALRWLAISSIMLLGCQFVVLPLSLAWMPLNGAVASASMFVGEFGVLFVLRLALVFLGAGVLGIFVYRAAQNPGQENTLSVLAYTAFVLVLVGEIVGRFLFYATATPFGLQ